MIDNDDNLNDNNDDNNNSDSWKVIDKNKRINKSIRKWKMIN